MIASCAPSPLADALSIQAHRINRDRFEVVDCKTGRFAFAKTEAGARAMACDFGWADFHIIPPVSA